MIPLRVLKESPFYDYLINEGKDGWLAEGELKALAETLRLLIAKRFPKVNVTQKIKRIRDVAVLQQLCLEAGDLKDAAALRKRLDEVIKSQSS